VGAAGDQKTPKSLFFVLKNDGSGPTEKLIKIGIWVKTSDCWQLLAIMLAISWGAAGDYAGD
jgi:hypothetical protein